MNKKKGAKKTKISKQAFESIRVFGEKIMDLNRQAVREYSPVVESIILTGSRNVHHIEQTLDGLLDFCCFDPALQLYRRLCRHYLDIDPMATAFYVNSYREMWNEESLSKADS
jgi:hypothetical protein